MHEVAKGCVTTAVRDSLKHQASQGILAYDKAIFLAPSGGLEPPTPGLGNRCSIP